YRIKLIVKDDNGDIDNFTRFLVVNNLDPEINICFPNEAITIYEGETLVIKTESLDDLTDVPLLEYWWDFEYDDYEFNEYNLKYFEKAGWYTSHIYEDDFKGSAYVMVKDPENYQSYDHIDINVLNVAPTISIMDSNIVADVSFKISRSTLDLNSNFSMNIISDEGVELKYNLNFTDPYDYSLETDKTKISMSLLKDWKIVIMCYENIPIPEYYEYECQLEFLNGETLIFSSGELHGDSDGYWEVDLNQYFYDNKNFNFKYPLTFDTLIWDPSKDDVYVDFIYNTSSLINLECITDLVDGDSYLFTYTMNDVMYNIRIYNENSQIYANITASQILLSQLYDNNAFPTKLEIPATINPLFDFDALTNIIQNELSLSEISLISCLGIIHKVFASVEDDDGGKINQTITYRTYPDIWFGNLSPKLIPGIPDKSMAHNITLYAQISDFNQLFGQYTYDYEHLITSDKKPFDAQSFIETNDKSIYIVDSADTSTLLKLDKDTMSWINIITIDSAYEINKMHYDRDNEKIYLGCSNSISLQLIEIDLIDFNNKSSDIIYAQDFQIIDVIQLLDTLYIATTDMDNGEVYMLFTEFNSESLSWGNSYSINMGSVDVRDFEVSYCVVINDNIYYQWQWNDENVEFWVFNITNKSFKRIKLAFAPIYPIDMSTYHVNSNYNFDYLKKDDTFNFEISTIIYDNSDNGIYEKSLNHAYVDQQETHGESFTGNGAGYVLEADNPWSALENGAGGRRYFNTYDATAFVGGSRDYYDTYNIYSYPAPNGVSSIPYDDETFVLDNIIVDIKEATWEKCCYRYGSVQPYAQLEIKDQISGAWHSMGYYVLPYGTQNPSWKTYQYKSGTWRGYYSGTTTKSSISNYINPNSKLVQTRVHWHGDQLLTVVIFFVPVFELSMYSYQDVWRVETLWRAKNASTQFNFGEELLDGSNDYYLFFQGKTDEGIAELKVNGQTKFNFGDIMETKDWYLIENVSSIEIYQGNSYNVDIDYLYLRPVADCEMNIERPQRSLAYDDLNIISFVLTDSETGKNNFYTYNIDSGSINKVDDLDINLMLDRNTAPENFEKAFQISGNKIYQIGLQGTIELVAELDITGSIIAISDNYLFTDDGSIYELNIPCFNGLCLSNYTDENQLILKELSLNSYLSGQYYTVFEKDFAFTNQGSYLVTMTADDGELITTNGAVIEIDLPDPFASIGDLPEGIIEDQQVELTSDILIFGSNEVNPSDYKFMWSFGDGTYAYVQNPVHAWSNSGTYKISLIVEDCYGDIYMAATNISIEEQKPEIKGPFSFQGVEGQAIILDLEIYDSFLDEQWLKYTWYDENGNEKLELKNNKKPTIILDDGNYIYTLEVEDQDNNIATANINILVEDIPPTIFVSSYIYSGAPGNDLELKAYVSDYFNDFDNLKYEWTIKAGMNSYYFIDKIGGQCSQIIFENCEHTTIYHGTLKVTDEQSGKISVSNFVIDSIIDENQNGVNDFIEWMLDESEKSYNPGIFYPDSDNDNYIDIFEQRVGSETLWNVTDTDGDGLLDGFNDQFIGEYTAGTSPNDPDTDDDLLNDSIEVLGWDITSEITGVIHVISNPLNGDTDSDGLSDYTEFIKGTDPRTPDTDKDGLLDGFDPFPMKQDGDDDGLSDYREFMIGTELNNSDTDGDGLSDGQEVIGWGFQTNPLTSDSDHDFLADNAETTVYKFELNERLDLDNPVSLKFEEYCTKALSAQISFIIAFGEAVNDENTYGIQDVPDLNVKITKADDNLILFNENTNKSRYFSKAIDIREMIENRSLDYRGEYVISINETDAGCLLEQFKIIVTKYLDPNNPDYDGDEIMDGVETSLLVNGNQKIDFKDIYLYNNLTIFEDSTSFNEFLLEIPDIGVVFDANVSIKIESNEITKGAGNLNLQIIKEDINMSIGDYVLINYVDTFSSDSIYIYETTLDLSDFIELGLIGEYYGTYKLKIQIISSDFTDVFNVTEFYFDTATFIQAGAKDTDAWMTNPAKWDTDGDGWSDKFEIYERDEPTNPLNDDTDADGVKDSRDIDPLRDVYIEISPINGYHGGFLWLWD
ncbi:MAG: PKD domain-containing protein, partial [Promethearchaeota archaeon]